MYVLVLVCVRSGEVVLTEKASTALSDVDMALGMFHAAESLCHCKVNCRMHVGRVLLYQV